MPDNIQSNKILNILRVHKYWFKKEKFVHLFTCNATQ
jgi:hypothetical protein